MIPRLRMHCRPHAGRVDDKGICSLTFGDSDTASEDHVSKSSGSECVAMNRAERPPDAMLRSSARRIAAVDLPLEIRADGIPEDRLEGAAVHPVWQPQRRTQIIAETDRHARGSSRGGRACAKTGSR